MKVIDKDKNINVIWKDRKRYFGMPISFTRYAFIEKPDMWKKLFCEIGLLTTSIEEVHIYRIDDIEVYQSLFDKIFGVGNVTIHCQDASCKKLILQKVKDPYRVRALLNDAVEKARGEKRVFYGEMQ